jgi:hypothetical protein
VRALLVFCTMACSSEIHTEPSDCPRYDVTPDAAIVGFGTGDQWRTDSICDNYCTDDFTVCKLASPTTVRCQKACE